jgi:hypothetical protein
MSGELPPDPETLESIQLHGRSLQDWHDYLTTDPDTGRRTGRLGTPVSRYGRVADDCAFWAIAAEIAFVEESGPSDEPELALDFLMGLVVNDHAEIATIVFDAWRAIPPALQDRLTGAEEIRQERDADRERPFDPEDEVLSSTMFLKDQSPESIAVSHAMDRVGEGATFGPLFVGYHAQNLAKGRIVIRGECEECGATATMLSDGRPPSLRHLATTIVNVSCQQPDSCPARDALDG